MNILSLHEQQELLSIFKIQKKINEKQFKQKVYLKILGHHPNQEIIMFNLLSNGFVSSQHQIIFQKGNILILEVLMSQVNIFLMNRYITERIVGYSYQKPKIEGYITYNSGLQTLVSVQNEHVLNTIDNMTKVEDRDFQKWYDKQFNLSWAVELHKQISMK